MFKWFLFCLLFFYPLFYSPKTLTRNDWFDEINKWPHETKDFSKDLYERALLFAPEILSPKDSLSHPYIEINGRKVYLNSAFWSLVKGWLRIYQEEIKTYCDCDIDPEKLAEQARDSVPKGFFQSKISGTKNTIEDKAIHAMEKTIHHNNDLDSSLHIAAGLSDPSLYDYLKQFGDTTLKNRQGNTPEQIFESTKQKLPKSTQVNDAI